MAFCLDHPYLQQQPTLLHPHDHLYQLFQPYVGIPGWRPPVRTTQRSCHHPTHLPLTPPSVPLLPYTYCTVVTQIRIICCQLVPPHLRNHLYHYSNILRWNSWMAILFDVSGHKLESSQTWVFVWCCTPHFSVLQNAIHEQTQVFLFRGFFKRILKILKPEKSRVFFKIRQKKDLWIAWSKRLESFVKLMPRIPSLVTRSKVVLSTPHRGVPIYQLL